MIVAKYISLSNTIISAFNPAISMLGFIPYGPELSRINYFQETSISIIGL